jgi:hypothetical protein
MLFAVATCRTALMGVSWPIRLAFLAIGAGGPRENPDGFGLLHIRGLWTTKSGSTAATGPVSIEEGKQLCRQVMMYDRD